MRDDDRKGTHPYARIESVIGKLEYTTIYTTNNFTRANSTFDDRSVSKDDPL
jgi:hypothetical protein